MSVMRLFAWVGFAGLFSPFFTSCSRSVEGFCQAWAEDTCDALTGCCRSGELFDRETCRIGLSNSCQDDVEVEKVHAGEYLFDDGAAGDCFGTVASCSDADATGHETYAHKRACAGMLTGYRPLGAACSSSKQCEKSGDYSTCVGSGSDGVCAKVSLSGDNKCSFSLASFEVRVCPDGTYCDTSDYEVPASASPSVREYEYSGVCRAYVGAGQSCIDMKGGQIMPCADGLYCDYSSYDNAVCTKLKTKGQSCSGSDECGDGLYCDGDVCAQGLSGSFCYAPIKCGDGTCQSPETPSSCPQDCGGGGY